MTRKRGVGQKRKKEPEGRTQGCRSGEAGNGPVPARHTAQSRSGGLWGPLPPGLVGSGEGSGAKGGRKVWLEVIRGQTLFTLALPMFSLGPSSCSQK